MWRYDGLETHRNEMTFLNVKVYRVRNYLHYRPFVKPSSSGVPLSACSAHPNHVHAMWTIGRLGVLAAHSSSFFGFEAARANFIKRLKYFNFPRALTKHLEKEDPYTRGRVRDILAFPSETRAPVPWCSFLNRTRLGEFSPFWIPIPWHPCWFRAGFNSVIRTLTSGPVWRQLLFSGTGETRESGQQISLLISWQLRSECCLASIRKINVTINDLK